MGKPYSEDLRRRVVSAVEKGMSRREAASLYEIGASTVIRWVDRWEATASVAAKPMGGDHRSRLQEEREWLLARVAEAPDLTLEEIRAELGARGVQVGYGTVWRFFRREDYTVKKNGSRSRTRES
jgi:transposase